MQERCMDSYSTTFNSYPAMLGYHQELTRDSRWVQCPINELKVEPLDRGSEAHFRHDWFAEGTSALAIEDTVDNLGLSMRINEELFPVRATAWKGLLDRAKINGTALPKLPRNELAGVLNACLHLFQSEALLLIRDEKVSAVHSGDQVDYSILPIDELLEGLQENLDKRFPGNEFECGYSDHAIVGASWRLPKQKEDLLDVYAKMLKAHGKDKQAEKLVPGIQFISSDTGVASAKVSALLMGGDNPIHIGSCVAVDHRHQNTVADFELKLDELFAQFGDNIKKLQKLLEIPLRYPVNAMTRICKQLVLPKKAADEAIARFEMTYGDGCATAHDVFMALQEIPFLLKVNGVPETKRLCVEENLAKVLSFNWSDYDLARSVDY